MGVIGGEEQKDRLSFVSFIRQINTGLEQAYKEQEIIDSVIRAISPSLKLRSYLETMKELTLPKLRQMLRAHYKQKSGTELYRELTTMCQSPKVTPQGFLIRALDIRQQVHFASQAGSGTVKYEPSLVHPLFLFFFFFFFFFTVFYFYFILNIQVSHHLQIAKLIKAGGVWTA